ncbi:MAG: ABC transporter ATP-binding protein [Rhodospirillales bacterium]|nr:ABC transporter ATP-binding protein [Rhodospirillales bacterium]
MNFLKLENVVVEFPVYGVRRSFRKDLVDLATGGIIRTVKKDIPVVTALEDINLEIKPGDRLGLVGHNGSGKSTLLKVMAKVYEPTGGIVESVGRITALFNTTAGMDLDSSGYDNIYSVGMMLDMSMSEIKAKRDEIAEFSELGEYLDFPVRTYSSGMQLRLAFSIASSVETEILLLDEGLGAGDARFAEKAIERVNKLVARSSILVLASHSEAMIRQFCNKAVLMEHGKIVAVGPVEDVLRDYGQRVHSAA